MSTSDIVLEIEIKKWQEVSKSMLSLKVIRYENIPSEIFVFERNLDDGNDYMSHVASPSELATLPKYAPSAGSVYYLDHNFDFEFSSAKDMEDTLALLLLDLLKLKEDWLLVKNQMNITYNVII